MKMNNSQKQFEKLNINWKLVAAETSWRSKEGIKPVPIIVSQRETYGEHTNWSYDLVNEFDVSIGYKRNVPYGPNYQEFHSQYFNSKRFVGSVELVNTTDTGNGAKYIEVKVHCHTNDEGPLGATPFFAEVTTNNFMEWIVKQRCQIDRGYIKHLTEMEFYKSGHHYKLRLL